MLSHDRRSELSVTVQPDTTT